MFNSMSASPASPQPMPLPAVWLGFAPWPALLAYMFPDLVLWRWAGRMLCVSALLFFADDVVAQRLQPEVCLSMVNNSNSLTSRAVLGAISGVSFKVVDLWAEHGLPSFLPVIPAICGSLMFIPLFLIEPSWPVAEILFHGVIRGKCNEPLSYCVSFMLLGILIHVPLCSLVDWNAIAIYVCAGLAYNYANKQLHWGDSYVNQFRLDKLVMLGAYPHFFAVAASEQVAYACTKIIAKQFAWYKE